MFEGPPLWLVLLFLRVFPFSDIESEKGNATLRMSLVRIDKRPFLAKQGTALVKKLWALSLGYEIRERNDLVSRGKFQSDPAPDCRAHYVFR